MGWKSGKSLHGEDWLKLAGVAAAVAAPLALPALGIGGAAAGAGAAGAELGAGAAAGMGSGLAAADYAALGLGTPLAESGLLAAAPGAAYGGELASVGELGGSMLGGAAPTSPTVLPGDWGGTLDALQRVKAFGPHLKSGLKTAQLVNGVTNAMSPRQPAMPAPPRQPQMPTGSFMDAIADRSVPIPGDPDYQAYLEFIRRRNRGY